jgi:hypothetical protein
MYFVNVFENYDLNIEVVKQINEYIPDWSPPDSEIYKIICVRNNFDQLGIYEIGNIINIFSIRPLFVHELSHIKDHYQHILEYILHSVKALVDVKLANEIGFKIYYYKPSEVSHYIINSLRKSWRINKNVRSNIFGTPLEVQHDAYQGKLMFDKFFNITF